MRYRLFATLAVFVSGVSLPAGDRLAAENKLDVLERFAGEWVVDGKWADGNPLHARGVYEWSLGKKIMRTRTFVNDGKKEYQRYEGVLAWHPEKKCLYQVSFAFDGAISEFLIEAKEKDTLHIGWGPLPGGKAPKVRQTIRFLDNDHFRWVVQVQDGDDWKQIIDATWQRKGK
jgi:hypothetical protein